MYHTPREVRDYARSIMREPQYVQIDEKAVDEFLMNHPWVKPTWPSDRHFYDPSISPERAATLILLIDSANFCFWDQDGDDHRWAVFDEKAQQYVGGYYGLVVAMREFINWSKDLVIDHIDGRADILDKPNTIWTMTDGYLKNIFLLRARGNLALIPERVQSVQQTVAMLMEQFDSSVEIMVREANHSAVQLVETIARNFDTWQDPFLKRTQLFVADIAGALGGKGLGYFTDLEELTAFADYKIPWILMAHGILRYNPSLIKKLENYKLLPEGCQEEMEIRAATIMAVDMIAVKLRQQGHTDALSCWVDNWLWDQSQSLTCNIPHHRTITTRY